MSIEPKIVTIVADVDNQLQSSLRRDGPPRIRIGVSVSFQEPERLPATKYQIIVLCMCSYINFTSNMSFTILASFFYENATSHGLSKTQIGLIVAIYAGIATIGCPVFGIYLEKLGKKFTLIAGLFIGGVCAGLFALLDDIKSPSMYLWIGLLLRSVQAIGVSAYFTATYAYLVEEWRGSRLSVALGIFEAFTGLGMILGPLMGSVLYSIGGYRLPFLVVSGMTLAAAGINCLVLDSKNTFGVTDYRSISEDDDDELIDSRELGDQRLADSVWYGIKVLMSNGLFLIPNLLMIPVWSCMDFAIPFVGPYLETCEPSTTKLQVGELFVIFAVAYMIMSPIWGFICGRFKVSRMLMFTGSLFAALSYLFLGPSPWLSYIGLNFSCSFTNIALSMTVLGMSLSAAIIPSCNEMVQVARNEGVEEQTSNFIAGLSNSLVFFGEFIGPTLGGFMLDYADGDFSVGCSYFSIICVLIVLFCGGWWTLLLAKRKCHQMGETVQQRRIRRTTEDRISRRRRRRLHSSNSFSIGPLSLTESLGSSQRMQYNDLMNSTDVLEEDR